MFAVSFTTRVKIKITQYTSNHMVWIEDNILFIPANPTRLFQIQIHSPWICSQFGYSLSSILNSCYHSNYFSFPLRIWKRRLQLNLNATSLERNLFILQWGRYFTSLNNNKWTIRKKIFYALMNNLNF